MNILILNFLFLGTQCKLFCGHVNFKQKFYFLVFTFLLIKSLFLRIVRLDLNLLLFVMYAILLLIVFKFVLISQVACLFQSNFRDFNFIFHWPLFLKILILMQSIMITNKINLYWISYFID